MKQKYLFLPNGLERPRYCTSRLFSCFDIFETLPDRLDQVWETLIE